MAQARSEPMSAVSALAAIQREQKLPTGEARLDFSSIQQPDPLEQKPPRPGYAYVQFVSAADSPVQIREDMKFLVAVDNFWTEVNNVANSLAGTEGAQYALNAVNPDVVDWNTRVAHIRTVGDYIPVPRRLSPEQLDQMQRGHGSIAVPIVAAPTRQMAKRQFTKRRVRGKTGEGVDRLIQRLKQRAAAKGQQSRTTQQSLRALEAPLTEEEEKRTEYPLADRQVMEEIDIMLMPWLVGYGENVTEEELDATLDFITTKLGQGKYAQSLFAWAHQRAQDFEEGKPSGVPSAVLWPFVRWAVGLSEQAEADRWADVHLRRLPESQLSQEVAFQTAIGDIDRPLFWAECECCKRWRLLGRELSAEESSQPWTCGMPSMETRIIPGGAEVMSQLRKIREQLRNQLLPNDLRADLQKAEKQLCEEMCRLGGDVENDEEARDLMHQYFTVIVQNPKWKQLMERLDTFIEGRQREQTKRIGGWVEETAEEQEPRAPKPTAATLQPEKRHRLRLVISDDSDEDVEDVEEEHKRFATDDSDVEETTGRLSHQKRQERAQIREGRRTRFDKRIRRAVYLGSEDQPEQKLDWALDRLGAVEEDIEALENKPLGEWNDADRRAMKDLSSQEKELKEQIAILKKQVSRDPTFPVQPKMGEQYEVRMLQELAKPEHASGVKYATIAATMNVKEPQTINKLINPRNRLFLGTKTTLGAPTVAIQGRSGIYVSRDFVRTEDDVDRIVRVQREQLKLRLEAAADLRQRLNRILEENEILPYVLGGAFWLLALNYNQPDETLGRLLVKYFPQLSDQPVLVDRLLKAWKEHLDSLQQEHVSATRDLGALIRKRVLPAAEKLDESRTKQAPVIGMRYPWWLLSSPQWMRPVGPKQPVQMSADPEPETESD